jgi:hypothetical protein
LERRSELRSKPHLDVERSEQALYVQYLRLDFDDHDDAPLRVERQQVDAPAFAVVTERDLDLHGPTQCFEQLFRVRLERGMAGVQQSVQLRAAPPAVDPELDAERTTDLCQRAAGECHRSVALELGDRASADARTCRQIRLAPSEPMPDCSNNHVDRPTHVAQSGAARITG